MAPCPRPKQSPPGAPARFVGWQRVGRGPWVAVVEGATEWQAHEKLLDHPCPGPGRDLTVLPAGRDPNEEGRRR